MLSAGSICSSPRYFSKYRPVNVLARVACTLAIRSARIQLRTPDSRDAMWMPGTLPAWRGSDRVMSQTSGGYKDPPLQERTSLRIW